MWSSLRGDPHRGGAMPPELRRRLTLGGAHVYTVKFEDIRASEEIEICKDNSVKMIHFLFKDRC